MAIIYQQMLMCQVAATARGITATMPQRTVSVAFAMFVSAACPGREPRQSAETAFVGTTAPLLRLRPAGTGVPAALLRSVTAASAVGYDRVVFELASDTAPGYRGSATWCPACPSSGK